MAFESKLIPILRDGVTIIKMVFFKELKTHLGKKYPDRSPEYIGKLSGAIINDLFGTPNNQESFAAFVKANQSRIQGEMETIATDFEQLRIPLTDALRVQFLCDSLEGIESEKVLSRAKALDILILDRNTPLPKNFMRLSRKLGVAYKFLPESCTDNLEPK